jgi:hypothetical protein
MTTNMRTRTKRRTALRWAVVTTGGFGAGTLLAATPATALAVSGAPAALVGLTGGAVLGGILGGAQWLELRQQVDTAGWWIPASMVGGMLGFTGNAILADRAPSTVRAALPPVVAGAIAGGLLGGAQAVVLRRQVCPAGSWIVASALGWSAACGLAAKVASVARVPIGLLIGGAAAGTITGMVLARLLPPEGRRPAGLGWAGRVPFRPV